MVFEDTPASRRRHARSHMYPQAQRASDAREKKEVVPRNFKT